MDGNVEFNFDGTVINAFSLARSISKNIQLPQNLIPKELFLTCLFLVPDTPMYNHLKRAGLSEEKIYEKTLDVMKKFVSGGAYKFFGLSIEGYEPFTLDSDIMDILEKAQEISEVYYGKKVIEVSDLIAAFAELYPDFYNEAIIHYLPNYGKPMSSSVKEQDIEKEVFMIPTELASFLTNLNTKYSKDSTECHICGRDEEIKQLTRILMKMTKRNAVLIGEPGVGKSAIVEKLTWMIVTGNCPKAFKDSIVLSLDVNAIVAGTKYRGTAEERFMALISFLENNPNCILFVDEIHLLLGAGACKEGDLDLANAMKPLLARGTTQVIGATTTKEYEEFFSKDAALKRRFEKVLVNEPKADEVYDMIKNQIRRLEKKHHTTISRELVDFVILNASCYNFETKNPDRTLDLLDKAMVCAEIEERAEVTKEDVLENFSINKKKFEKLSPAKKESTAYHEAGHYILHRFADQLSEYNILAVSIIPAEDYLGVNVFEIDQDITPIRSKEYFIQLMASFLAGRIAEKRFSHNITAGASSDLEKATHVAKNVITRYGLDEDFSDSRVFLRESKNPMYTDELITNINKRIDKLLKEAREYAENLLEEKSFYLESLAKALMEHGIMSAHEIDKLFEECENQISVNGQQLTMFDS